MGVTNFDKISTTNAKFMTVSKVTNGTTPVDIIGSTVGFGATLTSILFLSLDDANGSIDVYSNSGTVAKITTKGSLGVVKGTALANTTLSSTSTFKAVSSATGNVAVIATFQLTD